MREADIGDGAGHGVVGPDIGILCLSCNLTKGARTMQKFALDLLGFLVGAP